jgi:hypothetical protein
MPTGRIALENLAHALIVEFGVEPRQQAWSEILASNRAALVPWRTWG